MKNLRHIRRLRFMTQEELAAAVGVTVKTVSRWEQGAAEPHVHHLRKLCEVLNVAPQALIGELPDDELKEAAA